MALFKGELPVQPPQTVTSEVNPCIPERLATDAMSATLYTEIYTILAEHDRETRKLFCCRRSP